jgi:hypothetical protein
MADPLAVTHSYVEGLLPDALSLSLFLSLYIGSDEEGTWCGSSEEVMYVVRIR